MASTIVRRIIFSPKVAQFGPYSQAVQVNSTLYVSGQIGANVKGDLVGDNIEVQTRQALDNLGHILEAAGVTFKHVVKATVLLADISTFQSVNKIYAEYFNDKPPARAAYQVATLPKDALIEIEAVAVVGDITDAKL